MTRYITVNISNGSVIVNVANINYISDMKGAYCRSCIHFVNGKTIESTETSGEILNKMKAGEK